ncbi:MAG: protease inhibitor I42 family protein [Candidatus Bipolaricaulota bacterium]|nr:protease inhibitor I42 family protein [Candidatus Bipolaricaulota bacterium]
MMKKLHRIALVSSCLLLVVASGLAVSSSSQIVPPIEVRLSGFAMEPGATVALELSRSGEAACLDENVVVHQIELVDADGSTISVTRYETPVEAVLWIGAVALVDESGLALAPGSYEIRIETSIGQFVAALDVVPTAQFGELGHSSAEAAVCGISLRVYRLLTNLDLGAQVALRTGDRLMVQLAGNPTTGYSWTNTLIYEYAVVRETEEAEYRSDSTLIGAGGLFVFRYQAVDAGMQDFLFGYARPWETVEPIETLALSVSVY